MSKKGLKPKQTGREPNDLCPCNSGIKYKRCCGKGTKGTGIIPRESANIHNKPTQREVMKSARDSIQLKMMAETMRTCRVKRI